MPEFKKGDWVRVVGRPDNDFQPGDPFWVSSRGGNSGMDGMVGRIYRVDHLHSYSRHPCLDGFYFAKRWLELVEPPCACELCKIRRA